MERVGRYEIVRTLAKGGMGEVLLGRLSGPAGFARPVVLKRVRTDIDRQMQAEAMLLDEARLTSRLSHPNIAQGIDLVQADDGVYLVMEFVDGTDFGRLLRLTARDKGPVDMRAIAWVVSRVACALHFAHHAIDPQNGRPLSVIHRDVTPSNVLLSRGGEVKLTDFGVAKAETQQVKTVQGTLKGKVGYLSPEQCNLKPLDGRSDIFSLGVVMHEALCLRRLFRESNPMRSMERICDEAVLPPSHYNTNVPATLDAIVAKALHKDPRDRYQSAGAFQRALEEWMLVAPGSQQNPERVLVDWIAEHDDEERTDVLQAAKPTKSEIPPPVAAAKDTIRVRQTSAIYQAHQAANEDRTLKVQSSASLVGNAFPLPRFSTPHVGRDVELQAMRAHFQHGGQALAIVGDRGVGKTRLAVEFCRRVRSEGARGPFRSDIYVDAAMITRLDTFCERLADALDVQLLPADDRAHLSQLSAALNGLGDVLLVFDDVRAGGVPDALLSLQAETPLARFVVVSRESLDLAGFSLFRLRNLTDDNEAAALFAGSIREVAPDFVLDDLNRAELNATLASLQGHPQSIALVAGVVGGSASAHKGLTKVAAAFRSNRGLSEPTRVVEWALSMAGAETLGHLALIAAFEGAALASEISEIAPALDGRRLHHLVRRGFLRLIHGPAENAYAVTELVHQVARPTFEDAASVRAVTVARAEFAVQNASTGQNREAARAYLEFVRERLLPLAEQALTAQDPQMAARLALVALRMGVSSVHATALLDRIANALGDDDLGVRLEIALGNALYKRGKDKGAARVLAHATSVARRGGDNKALALALLEQGKVDAVKQPQSARVGLDEALAIVVDRKDFPMEERVLTARAQVLVSLNLDDDAYADLKRARELARERGSRAREGRLALAMAAIADRADKTAVAAKEAKSARAHLEAAQDTRGVFEAGLLLGHVLVAESQLVEAKRVFSDALAIATKQGNIPAQVRALSALAAAAALDEGRSASLIYTSGVDALMPGAPDALAATVAVYRSIIDFAAGESPPNAVRVDGADAMATRLFERLAIGRHMTSTAVH